MNAKIAIWLFFRALRWLCWIGFFAYCFFVTTDRETQLDQFGHLPFAMELLMIGLGVAAFLRVFKVSVVRHVCRATFAEGCSDTSSSAELMDYAKAA
jgi:hypothetical protein